MVPTPWNCAVEPVMASQSKPVAWKSMGPLGSTGAPWHGVGATGAWVAGGGVGAGVGVGMAGVSVVVGGMLAVGAGGLAAGRARGPRRVPGGRGARGSVFGV